MQFKSDISDRYLTHKQLLSEMTLYHTSNYNGSDSRYVLSILTLEYYKRTCDVHDIKPLRT